MISKRQLYAAGEPLGDGATRHKLGGGRIMGFGGGGSDTTQTSTQTSITNMTDARQAIDNRIVNNQQDNRIAGNQTWTDVGNTETNSRNVYNVSSTDAGAVAAGAKIASDALKAQSTDFAGLLSLGQILFSKSQNALDANVQLAGTLATSANQAYSDATSQATGSKNVVLVAIAAVGIVAAYAMFKK